MYNDAWDDFFGNPILKNYLTEADEMQAAQEQEQPVPAPEGAGSGADIEQLSADLKDGHITQDDLIDMYKSGKVSKDDIQAIVSSVEGEQAQAEAPGEDEPQSEEELFAQQIDQTNDMFVKFALYDKVADMTDKLNYFKDNFEDIQSDMYGEVLQLREFLNILSNLIFTIETSVAYQMYGSILLQLTELFNTYNQEDKAEALHDKIQDAEKEDYRSGEKSPDPVDEWADKNQSHLMPDEEAQPDLTATNP